MDLYKEVLEKSQSPLDECILRLSKYKEIILYGAGVSGRIISNWLKENKMIPAAFIDSNPDKTGKYLNGTKIYSKECITKYFGNAFVIISCGDYAIILNELLNLGINKDKIMYMDPKWITKPSGLREFINDNISKLQETFDILADDLSKKVFLNMLKYKITYDIKYIKEICSDYQERYFDRYLIEDGKIKNYVDAGGYNGDTIDAFIEKFGADYNGIYVFEPNEENVKQLEYNIQKKQYHGISVFKIGLSDKKEELLFDTSSGIASRIDVCGRVKVKCDQMDNILKDKQIDLIKMDIEGAELSALSGSREIIKKFMPVLAICIYHKPEDYFEIPMLIKKLCPNYKIYIRQYELSDTETICYAIGE
ncbi:FkbM family methyltransferase [Lachnospiraceae bacterium M18-1]|nr:FkbM family methyltransferase [Lachnospiraceae bacterium M18-1]